MHLIHVTTLFSRGGTPHEMKYEVIFLFKKTQGNELSVGEKCYFHSKHLNFLINEKKEHGSFLLKSSKLFHGQRHCSTSGFGIRFFKKGFPLFCSFLFNSLKKKLYISLFVL